MKQAPTQIAKIVFVVDNRTETEIEYIIAGVISSRIFYEYFSNYNVIYNKVTKKYKIYNVDTGVTIRRGIANTWTDLKRQIQQMHDNENIFIFYDCASGYI